MKLVLWTIGTIYGSISLFFLLVVYRVHHPKRTRIQREAEQIARRAFHGPLREVSILIERSNEQKDVITWAWKQIKQQS